MHRYLKAWMDFCVQNIYSTHVWWFVNSSSWDQEPSSQLLSHNTDLVLDHDGAQVHGIPDQAHQRNMGQALWQSAVYELCQVWLSHCETECNWRKGQPVLEDHSSLSIHSPEPPRRSRLVLESGRWHFCSHRESTAHLVQIWHRQAPVPGQKVFPLH